MKDRQLVCLVANATRVPLRAWRVLHNNMPKGPILKIDNKYVYPTAYIRFRFRHDDELRDVEALLSSQGEETIRMDGEVVTQTDIAVTISNKGPNRQVSIVMSFRHRTTPHRFTFTFMTSPDEVEAMLIQPEEN